MSKDKRLAEEVGGVADKTVEFWIQLNFSCLLPTTFYWKNQWIHFMDVIPLVPHIIETCITFLTTNLCCHIIFWLPSLLLWLLLFHFNWSSTHLFSSPYKYTYKMRYPWKIWKTKMSNHQNIKKKKDFLSLTSLTAASIPGHSCWAYFFARKCFSHTFFSSTFLKT